MEERNPGRRQFLQPAGVALTASFTGNFRVANDRFATAFISMGRMGIGKLAREYRVPWKLDV